MFIKLNDSEGLEKAGKSLGGYFAKQADELAKSQSFHENLAQHHGGASVTHDELKKAHEEHAALHEKASAALDEGHELKAHHALKAALHKAHGGHHAELTKLHKAMADAHAAQAEHYKAEVNAMKTLVSEWGGTAPAVTKTASGTPATGADPTPSTGNPIADMVQETTKNLTKMTLESMGNDPEVKQFMRSEIMKMVSEAIGAQLGDKLVPTSARATLPLGIRPVERPGQRAVVKSNEPEVPIEFEDLVKLDA